MSGPSWASGSHDNVDSEADTGLSNPLSIIPGDGPDVGSRSDAVDTEPRSIAGAADSSLPSDSLLSRTPGGAAAAAAAAALRDSGRGGVESDSLRAHSSGSEGRRATLTAGSRGLDPAVVLSASSVADDEDEAAVDPSPRFFARLQTRDSKTRRRAARHIRDLLTSPGESVLPVHLARVVALERTCPFQDVSSIMADIVTHARSEVGLRIPVMAPVSRFFPNSALPLVTKPGLDAGDQDRGAERAPGTSDASAAFTGAPDPCTLLADTFLTTGRVSNFDRLLSLKSEYMAKYQRMFNVVMHASGPLPLHLRHYFGIMAAARYRCVLVIRNLEQEFLLAGGPREWLVDGVTGAPTKIQNLLSLCEIMAHQPWKVNSALFEVLLKGADAWTTGELVHAMIIMATFFAVARISYGCGLSADVDLAVAVRATGSDDVFSLDVDTGLDAGLEGLVEGAAAESKPRRASDDATTDVAESNEFTASIAQRLRADTDEREILPDASTENRVKLFCEADDTSNAAALSGPTPEAAAAAASEAAFAAADQASLSSHLQSNEIVVNDETCLTNTRSGNVDRYRGDCSMQHEDFDVRSKEYGISRAQDYSWADHGFEMVSRFLPEAAGPLDELFKITLAMTDNKLNQFAGLDTFPIRQAIWQYIQRSKGILHDDYSYQNINVYLNKLSKQFIKKLVCFPESIVARDFADFGYDIAPYEKFHMSVLATESAKQAELLYGLRALVENRGGV